MRLLWTELNTMEYSIAARPSRIRTCRLGTIANSTTLTLLTLSLPFPTKSWFPVAGNINVAQARFQIV